MASTVDADAFDNLALRVTTEARVRKENRGEGASLYFLDPDGHKLGLHVETLASRLTACRAAPRAGMIVYD